MSTRAPASSTGPEPDHYTSFIPWRLSWVALTLFALYALVLLGDALPVRQMAPAWQLRLYSSVVNASSLPLMGLGLLHLSAHLAPDSDHLARRTRFFARLATPIAVGFLLLIPLQGFLFWQQSSTEVVVRIRQLERQERAIAGLRQAIRSSSSAAELQQSLKALQGPMLTPSEQALPMPQLRAALNASLDQVDRALQSQRMALPAPDPLNQLMLILRNSAVCLALALGFAALAQRRHAPVPLLMEWQYSLESILHWRPLRRSGKPRGSEQKIASYVEQLSQDVDQR